MADNQKLQLVKEVNATMERYGVQSQLPLNKAMTVGEFSELVSNIQVPDMSDDMMVMFGRFLVKGLSVIIIISNYYNGSVPGYITVNYDSNSYSIDIQDSNVVKYLVPANNYPSKVNVECEQGFQACWFITENGVDFIRGERSAEFNSQSKAVLTLMYFGD